MRMAAQQQRSPPAIGMCGLCLPTNMSQSGPNLVHLPLTLTLKKHPKQLRNLGRSYF